MNSHNFYHYDGLGSVVALSKYDSTLGSAVIVERYQYSPFGITTIYNADKTQEFDESQYGNPYMFTGRRYDSETGLYYYRMRYYSPDLGRFLQPDPIGYADGMNIYAYVGNNPLNFIDPWGLFEEPGWQGPVEKLIDIIEATEPYVEGVSNVAGGVLAVTGGAVAIIGSGGVIPATLGVIAISGGIPQAGIGTVQILEQAMHGTNSLAGQHTSPAGAIGQEVGGEVGGVIGDAVHGAMTGKPTNPLEVAQKVVEGIKTGQDFINAVKSEEDECK